MSQVLFVYSLVMVDIVKYAWRVLSSGKSKLDKEIKAVLLNLRSKILCPKSLKQFVCPFFL